MKKEKILIFDTTLRDGEQSPGASMNLEEKLEVARQLARLGVDIIEAGFPISSPGDFEAVKTVAKEVKGPVIAGLARCKKADLDAAAQAVKKAKRPRIHVFLATSRIHMKYKLRKAEQEIIRMAVEGVKYARKFVDDVEFSPEDASRTDLDFLAQVFDAVVDAGASTVNIPDTVGYAVPEEFGGVIRYLRENTRNGDRAVISVHCHNDLGLAVANSLTAIKNGARQIECTVNGLGERAGNCSLEELVMAIRTRKDYFKGFSTGVNTKQIINSSRLVSRITGIAVQRNKAIVGENAFAHESGIHVDGIIKERRTYEIMKPSDIGLQESRLVLGKHSGRAGFGAELKKLGYNLRPGDLDKAYTRFKMLADKKKNIYDEDIAALVEDELTKVPATYQLDYINITSGNTTVPTATVRLKKGRQVLQDASCGDGPIDAAYNSIDRIVKLNCKLTDYSLRAITGGKDAIGEVYIKLKAGKNEVSAKGASTDVIEASVKAYINAINKLIFMAQK
jgi:2-isopropylmalate synthase